MRAKRIVAVIGLGHMGRLHARKLAERGDLSLRFVDPALGFDDPLHDIDLAVIAAPTSLHVALAAPLLERGLPCLVEKPLAASVIEATPLAHHPHLSVAHVERFNPALAALEGCAPRFVSAERLSPFSVRGTDVDVIADLMIHDLDLAATLLGGPLREARALGIGVRSGKLDLCNARLELGSGVAQLSASRVSPERVRRLRVFEEGRYTSLDLLRGTAHRVRWGQGELEGEPVALPRTDALRALHAAWLAAADGGPAFPVGGAEALFSLSLAEAIRAAMG